MAENLTIVSCTSPKWANAGQSLIDCVVAWNQLDGAAPYPFTAAAQDTTTHGRELYAAIVAGKYGPIAPFSSPGIAPPYPKA